MPNKVKLLGNSLTDIYTELRVNQLIYNGNKLSLQSDLAQNSVDYEELGRESLGQKVILNVSKAYFSVLKAKRVLSIYQSTLGQLQEHLKTAEALYDIGKTSNLDVIKANVQIAITEEDIKKASNDLQSQIYALNNAIGWETDNQIDVEDVTDKFFAEAQAYSYNEVDLLDEMLAGNPDFKKVKLDYEATDKEIALTKADYYPSIYAFGAMDWEDSRVRVPMSNYNWDVGISLSYTIPFLAGSKVQEKTEQLRIKKEVVNANEETLTKKYELGLKTILLTLEDLKSRISSSKQIIELARESQRTAELKYSIGSGSSLDVIDAVQTMTTAEINYSQNLIDYLSAVAELHNLVGRNGSAFQSEGR